MPLNRSSDLSSSFSVQCLLLLNRFIAAVGWWNHLFLTRGSVPPKALIARLQPPAFRFPLNGNPVSAQKNNWLRIVSEERRLFAKSLSLTVLVYTEEGSRKASFKQRSEVSERRKGQRRTAYHLKKRQELRDPAALADRISRMETDLSREKGTINY